MNNNGREGFRLSLKTAQNTSRPNWAEMTGGRYVPTYLPTYVCITHSFVLQIHTSAERMNESFNLENTSRYPQPQTNKKLFFLHVFI